MSSTLASEMQDWNTAPNRVKAITKRNRLTSALLRLPGELRNKIWEYSCLGKKIKSVSSTYEGAPISNREPVGLLFACKQMRCEATPLFYRLSTFDIGDFKRWEDLTSILSTPQNRTIATIWFKPVCRLVPHSQRAPQHAIKRIGLRNVKSESWRLFWDTALQAYFHGHELDVIPLGWMKTSKRYLRPTQKNKIGRNCNRLMDGHMIVCSDAESYERQPDSLDKKSLLTATGS